MPYDLVFHSCHNATSRCTIASKYMYNKYLWIDHSGLLEWHASCILHLGAHHDTTNNTPKARRPTLYPFPSNRKSTRWSSQSYIIYDLSGIAILNSIQIAGLIEVKQAFDAQGQEMVITGVTKGLVRIFEILRLHMVFDIFPNVESAVQAREFEDSLQAH